MFCENVAIAGIQDDVALLICMGALRGSPR